MNRVLNYIADHHPMARQYSWPLRFVEEHGGSTCTQVREIVAKDFQWGRARIRNNLIGWMVLLVLQLVALLSASSSTVTLASTILVSLVYGAVSFGSLFFLIGNLVFYQRYQDVLFVWRLAWPEKDEVRP